MNLKEAFQAQNVLIRLFDYSVAYIGTIDNVITVKEKHFRSKAVKDLEDETVDATNLESKKFPADKVIDFVLKLIDEREKISKAINKAKLNMDFDLDSAVDANKKRHVIVDTFNYLISIKSSNTVQKNLGKGFIFNNEGNQVEYRYDIERIQTIDFDRERLRRIVKGIYRKADEVSNQIDLALLNTQVDYELPFDIHGDYDSIIEDYVNSN